MINSRSVIMSFMILGLFLSQGGRSESIAGNKDALAAQKNEVTAEKTKIIKETWACPHNCYHGEKTKNGKCKCGLKLEKEIILRELGKDEIGKEYVCPVTQESFKGSALTQAAEYKGKTYYFCCAGCPGTFIKNPEKFIKKEDKK